MSKKSSNINGPEPSIADRIDRKEQQSKNCGLDDAFLASIDAELEVLSKYFKTTKMQAFFIANIIPMSFNERSVGFRELITYYNCNPMAMIKYTPELEGL